MEMKTLNDVTSIRDTEYIRRKIVRYNNKTFKICYDSRNGVEDICVMVMTNDGNFEYCLTKYDIGHKFTCSYVSSTESKNSDSNKAILLSERLIKKIYTF